MNEAPLEPVGPIDVLDLFPEERQALLDLLGSLSDEEWGRPTVCEGWSVKDIAAHLLGDDLGRLSRGRDSFNASLFLPEGRRGWEHDLLEFIDELNWAWVLAARRFSPRVLIELLAFSGEATQRYFESLEMDALGDPVSWAGPEAAPVWLDVAREYTERWLHQQQMRDAVDRPGMKGPRLFAPVLDALVRALPHTFRKTSSRTGTKVTLTISGDSGGTWTVAREDDSWSLYRGAAGSPNAAVEIDQETAWRLFTKGVTKKKAQEQAAVSGDRRLALKVLETVSIIA